MFSFSFKIGYASSLKSHNIRDRAIFFFVKLLILHVVHGLEFGYTKENNITCSIVQ